MGSRVRRVAFVAVGIVALIVAGLGLLPAQAVRAQITPNLTINDVSLNEGNAGTTTFTFTVSLSAPAPAGGVTFDIATANGTATAPGDYTAKSLTGQTIPAGSSTYTFDVLVNGDTTVEPNETFLVNVTNVTNAIATDGQGQGTIVNDDTVPQTYTVTTMADTANDANCAVGSCTLRQAVNASNGNNPGVGSQNAIVFDATAFPANTARTIMLNPAFDTLPLDQSVTIDGTGATIAVDGNHTVTVFRVNSGTVTLNALTIQNGAAPAGSCGGVTCGGGIYNVGTLTVTNSTIANNAAVQGGGIANGGTLTVTNSTFSGNSTTGGRGGGIHNNSGTLTVTNSTFSGNSAPSGGGGIYTDVTDVTLTNTIVANSPTGGDCASNISTFTADSHDLDDDGSCGGASVATSAQINLQPLASNGGPTQTFALGPGSAAIDQGAGFGSGPAGNTVPANDQRGKPRVNAPDIGAYEVQGFTTLVNSTAADSAANTGGCDTGNAGTCRLRDAVAVANGGGGGASPTITFAQDTTVTLDATAGTLTLSHNMTIDGSNHTVIVDGGCTGCDPGVGFNPTGGVRVFTINGGKTVGLTALTIRHGHDTSGTSAGIANNGGTLTLTGSTVAANAAIAGNTFGGGIATLGTLHVVNSTISGNIAKGTGGAGGGGIYYGSGSVSIASSTISGNTAQGGSGASGGGVYSAGLPGLAIANSIIAGNTGGDLNSPPVSSTNNMIGGAALLAPLGNYGGPTQTMPPLPGSPVINAGSNAAATGLTTDQRGTGFPRVVGGTVDIGAVESSGFTLTKQHDGQSTGAGTPFASPLAVSVSGSNSEPVDQGQVTFTIVPAVGGAAAAFGTVAGCTNSNGNLTAVCTISGGAATTPTLTANGTLGVFTVTAAATGPTTQTFSLTNTPGPATHFSVSAPTNATAGVAFNNLIVTALDQFGNTATGYTGTVHFTGTDPQVTSGTGLPADTPFTVGDAGAHAFSATLKTAGTQTITATDSGKNTITGTSNSIAVVAAAPATITADPATTPQSAQVGHAFANQLKAIVKDAIGNPVSGVGVTFTAPGSGASGTFAGGGTTATTDTNGVATAPVFTANTTAGGYSVTADRTGTSLGTPATFSLTNTVGAPASIVAVAGGGQTAVGNSAFAINLQAKVTDASSNPLNGVVVTFTAPSSGASGVFTGTGTTTATATTNTSGIATAPVFTANTTAGGYTVAVSASGVATPATFVLTNTHGAVTQVTIDGLPSNGRNLRVGEMLQLTATATYADGTTQDVTTQVTWTSSNTNVATVGLHTGLVASVGPGTVTITATWTAPNGAAGSPATVTGTTQVTVGGGTAVGVAPVPAPASRPGSAGTTPPGGSPSPAPNPVPSGR